MALSRQEKEKLLAELTEEFKNSTSVAFADYRGLTVAQADTLRAKARESGVRYIVAKKSLFDLAAKNAGFEIDTRSFEGMIGAAFGHEDEVAPAKLLGEVGKTSTLKLLGGIFEGVTVPQEKMTALSTLPSTQELRGIVVGTMIAPVSAFTRVLNVICESRETNASV